MRLFGLCLLAAFPLLSCQKSLDQQVREQIRTLDGSELDAASIQVGEIRRNGGQAVAEVTIKTAVRMEKQGNRWVLKEVRLGDRRWERVDRILNAIENSRREQTVTEMKQLAEGIRKYFEEEGSVPKVSSIEQLTDTLNPAFMRPIIRIDAWWNPYRYRVKTASEFELRSAGPDGKFGNSDDLVTN